MAQLPPDGTLLIQQIDGDVVIFDRHTQEEFYRFDPSTPSSLGPTLGAIWGDDRFDPEQKCFTAFWAGYFYANS
ncbi:hypothetical protein [Rhodococcus phage REQ1]|uniref:hypothetical protein n=1 Tax=Rhodococcus phage REQ1 TaxID=1109712 RepID=UPI00023EEBEC|nr:hypothetical protein RoPhREQ1_gp11 [Rhodococcus phage REQ1]AEV52007.1 hypothetical protein [Rhodococcus phage REQ1]